MARKGKRLNHDDRLNIQGMLNMGKSLADIAERYRWNRSTISREVKRGTVEKEGISLYECRLLGKKYTVCNQCPMKDGCTHDRRFYDCFSAMGDAHEKKHRSHEGPRTGILLFRKIDEAVSKGIASGRSIEHIQRFDPVAGKVSAVTIRRWIAKGLMSVKQMQLRRAPKYMKAYSYTSGTKPFSAHMAGKIGRTMNDFREFMEANPAAVVIEQDSVVGKKTDRIRVFTQMIVGFSFQIGTVYRTSEAAEAVLSQTERLACLLMKHAPEKEIVFLCDNGTEFYGVEKAEELGPRIHVFFTRTYCSTDKPHCERNHELFRFPVPKGRSFAAIGLDQETVTGIFSNMDSYATKKTKWKRPCDLVAAAFSPEFVKETGIMMIDDNEVRLAVIC